MAFGSLYALLAAITSLLFRHRAPAKDPPAGLLRWPGVTILKPVYGLEKNLKENIRTACRQDYPEYQLVLSVQRPDDPALPVLREIEKEFGPGRVTVAVENRKAGCNGKINNLLGAYPHARHDVLVISDSDVRLQPDYLKAIVAPLADPQVGCACTLYRAACAEKWYEKLELLTLNADFMMNVVFAQITGISRFCLGASTAIRRSTLEQIGGLSALADYLVEDYEMGRRVWALGQKVAAVPYYVDTMVDLQDARGWWNHLVYWDQNTRAARPAGFFLTGLYRAVPFALFFAALRLFDPVGLSVLAGAVGVRLASAALALGVGLGDREGLRSLPLLPLRDLVAVVSWLQAFTKRTVIWRGAEFTLTRDGRLSARAS